MSPRSSECSLLRVVVMSASFDLDLGHLCDFRGQDRVLGTRTILKTIWAGQFGLGFCKPGQVKIKTLFLYLIETQFFHAHSASHKLTLTKWQHQLKVNPL